MIRCSCGNPLVSAEAICELCDVPIRPRTYRTMAQVRPLRVLADDLGLVSDDIDGIRAEVRRIVDERNRYEEIETRHCDGRDIETVLVELQQLNNFEEGYLKGSEDCSGIVAKMDALERQRDAAWLESRQLRDALIGLRALVKAELGSMECVDIDRADSALANRPQTVDSSG